MSTFRKFLTSSGAEFPVAYVSRMANGRIYGYMVYGNTDEVNFDVLHTDKGFRVQGVTFNFKNEQLAAAEGYYVEPKEDGVFQSVFPSDQAELSQLHTSISDALDYFAEVAPGVVVELL